MSVSPSAFGRLRVVPIVFVASTSVGGKGAGGVVACVSTDSKRRGVEAPELLGVGATIVYMNSRRCSSSLL